MRNKWLFIILLAITALAISGSAAYFSVFGLSKLFAGAGFYALILFGALEAGKIVSVSVLYRFWKRFSTPFKTVFTTMIIGIMIITSLGIYGFLRNAYDQTSNKLSTIDKQVDIQEQRKSTIQLEIDRYRDEIDSKNDQIDTYINNRNTQENLISNLYSKSSDTSLTSSESWVYRTRAKETQESVKETDNLISELRNNNDKLSSRINTLNDSLTNIEERIMDLQSTDLSVEIGPLKYLSELTGYDMDDVVGFLIFLIIFVFDPFAIILIMAANNLAIRSPEEKKLYEEREKEKLQKKKEKIERKKINNGNNFFQNKINNLAQRYTDNNLQKQINKIHKDLGDFNSLKNNVDTLIRSVNENNINSDKDIKFLKDNINDILEIKDNIDKKTNDIDKLKNNVNELYKVKDKMSELDKFVNDKNNNIQNDINKLKTNLDDVNNLKTKLNDIHKNQKDLEEIKNSIKSILDNESDVDNKIKDLYNKLDLSIKNNDNDDIQNILSDFKESIEENLEDYISEINEKVESLDKNKEIYNELSDIKEEYDNRLNEIDKKLKEKIELIETIPGRNTRRAAARIPTKNVKKQM